MIAAALCTVGLAAVAAEPEAVQLWDGGPYFATCNVGATKPEDYGYYFWWGDTVGYTHNGLSGEDSKMVSSKDDTVSISFNIQSSPANQTSDKTPQELKDMGFSDDASTGVLNASHDAATMNLGAPWRMPTSAEIDALISNCTTTWITTNGVNGQLVTGKDAYSSKSIFLPAAGYGSGSSLVSLGSESYYWSTKPSSSEPNFAYCLGFNCDNFLGKDFYRYYGRPVRAVCDTPPEDTPTAPTISAVSDEGALDLSVGDRVAKDVETLVVDPAWGTASEAWVKLRDGWLRTYNCASNDTWDTTSLEPGRYNLVFSAGEGITTVIYGANFWKIGEDWVVFDSSNITADVVFEADKTYLILGTNTVAGGKTLTVTDGAKFFYDEGAPAGFLGGLSDLAARYEQKTVEGDLYQIIEKIKGSADNPWDIGEGVTAYTNGTELVIGGEGTITDISEIPGAVVGAVEVITIAEAMVTGAASDAFAGYGDFALTLPDGWQGELPGEDGSWYGAQDVTLTRVPLAVKNVKPQQRYPWNGLVDVTYDLTGAGVVNVAALVTTNGVKAMAKPTVTGETTFDLGDGGELKDLKLIWDAKTDFGDEGVHEKIKVKLTVEPAEDAK